MITEHNLEEEFEKYQTKLLKNASSPEERERILNVFEETKPYLIPNELADELVAMIDL